MKLIWRGKMLDFPGFGDLQPYETWKFRICSEHFRGVSGFVPDFIPEMLNRTRGTAKFLGPKMHDFLSGAWRRGEIGKGCQRMAKGGGIKGGI